MEKSQVELPEDLMVRILERLPLISNLRFRCVCKAWHSLLSDPVFIYKTLTCIDCDDDDQVLINDYNPYTRRNGFSHVSVQCRTQLAIPATMEDRPRPLTIVGSLNGLICLTEHRLVILVWNPLTGDIKKLPESPNYTDREDFDELFESVTFEVGFCFDAEANDYTVIKIFHLFHDGLYYRGAANAVFLYGFLSGRWKKLDVPLLVGAIDNVLINYPPMIRTPTNCGEKFYHWVADPCTRYMLDGDDELPFVVLSFDMVLRRFETTEIPYTMNDVEKLRDRGLEIGFCMLKEHVAISASLGGAEEQMFEISVLVKVGVKESWMKLIRIGPVRDGQRILNPRREGKLFVKTSRREVKLWDPFEGEVVVVPSSGRHHWHHIDIITHKPTQQKIVLGLDC